jgi:predicted ester cyclase
MASITNTAQAFFDACDSGKGWDACAPFCEASASFTAQAEPLTEVRTVRDYAEWMKNLVTFMPDARYTLKSFATDTERNIIIGYAVFHGTHSGQGCPMPPTGKSTNTDYAYVMEFRADKIRRVTKIWNAPWAMRELGWVT